jgi:hypothetical protein
MTDGRTEDAGARFAVKATAESHFSWLRIFIGLFAFAAVLLRAV